jgi:hypothetical protein
MITLSMHNVNPAPIFRFVAHGGAFTVAGEILTETLTSLESMGLPAFYGKPVKSDLSDRQGKRR